MLKLMGRLEEFKSTLPMYYLQSSYFNSLQQYQNQLVDCISYIGMYVHTQRQRQLSMFVNQPTRC